MNPGQLNSPMRAQDGRGDKSATTNSSLAQLIHFMMKRICFRARSNDVPTQQNDTRNPDKLDVIVGLQLLFDKNSQI